MENISYKKKRINRLRYENDINEISHLLEVFIFQSLLENLLKIETRYFIQQPIINHYKM